MSLFSTKVLGDDKLLLKGKPAPDPYLLAAEKLNVDANDCWAVEDSNSGIKSALEAGCRVWILNNPSFKSIKNISNNNISYIKNLDEVLNQLRGQ